ncbi:MAG: hypothetical protein KF861_03430 [Planctomycetaceae bacterium]|nr:hypothetical protein [Planctomycetaceae bacterium]
MAAASKFDPRVDSLVVETKTLWGSDVGDLSAEDRAWVAAALHQNPRLAGTLEYERAHTGFTRIITVTADDIAKLYESRVS